MIGALDLRGEAGYLAELGWRVYSEAQRRGVYLRPIGNVVYVVPSLNIPDEDLSELLMVVRGEERGIFHIKLCNAQAWFSHHF